MFYINVTFECRSKLNVFINLLVSLTVKRKLF
jgi:hypothetical protein